MEKDIVLVTSIAPKNIENQRAAMESWMANGFRVISCNVKEELEEIQGLFPGVEFVEVARDARAITGKPCPYIYDMLQVLKEQAVCVCGIVNSDIHLQKCSDELYQFIKENAKEDVVFLRRQEVETMEAAAVLDSQLFFGGVDTFFFSKTAIDKIEDDGLILGQAMWDYWLPIMMHENGMKLKELMNPITFHVTHAVQWNDRITDQISSVICQKHFKEVEEEEAALFLKERFFEIVTKAEDICYVPEHLGEKQVLVIGKEKYCGDNEAGLKQQSHRNITYVNETQVPENLEKYDYVITIPYSVWMSKVFVSTMLWIMENYGCDAIQVFVYLRGNMSGVITIGNCNAQLQHDFNKEIEPVAVYQSAAYQARKKEIPTCLKPCKVCLCSILAEEDAEIIWPRQKLEGRVFVFPAGFAAKMWVRKYRNVAREITIEGFVDNDASREGTLLEGLKIHTPEILEQLDRYDKVLIVSNLYTGAICRQLAKIVPQDRIVVWKNEFDAEMWRQTKDTIKRMFDI